MPQERSSQDKKTLKDFDDLNRALVQGGWGEPKGVVSPTGATAESIPEIQEAAEAPTISVAVEKVKSQDEKVSTFNSRLFSDGIDPISHEGLLRKIDGAYLTFPELTKCCIETFKQHGYANRIANHMFNTYVKSIAEDVFFKRRMFSDFKGSSVDKNLILEKCKKSAEHLRAQISDIATTPSNYGIDLESQNKARHELRVDFESILNTLQDVDNVPDPLYVNGQLPMPKPLGDAFKRIFEALYPDTDTTSRTTRMLLKEKCVNQLVRELETAERLPTNSKEERTQKRVAVETAVARMTQFMREVLTLEGVAKYVAALQTGHMGPELVYFPSIALRPSYNDLDVGSDEENRKNSETFYAKLAENYSSKELADLQESFEKGDSSFFKDAAGPKTITHVYYDVHAVLLHNGYTSEEVATTFAPFVSDIIKKMIDLKNRTDAEYAKGFNRTQGNIEKLQQELGSLRRTFIKEAKKQIKEADILRLIVSDEVVDISAILQLEGGTLEEKEHSEIEFTCSDLSDRPTRQESFDLFKKALEERLKPFEGNKVANLVAENDNFVHVRDSYREKLGDFERLINTSKTPEETVIVTLANKIVEMQKSLISYYEDAQQQTEVE